MASRSAPDGPAPTALDLRLFTLDPAAAADIAGLLAEVAEMGLDPPLELRRRLHAWFGTRAALALPKVDTLDGGHPSPDRLALEALPSPAGPALWPQRPKRRDDELLSSWVWRSALAAHAPPRLFARDILLRGIDDVDRDTPPGALRRLAARSGQSVEHLAGGLLLDSGPGAPVANEAEAPLLQDRRFLLARQGCSRRGRERAVLQYCPLCLRVTQTRHFRRSWRLSPVAVCPQHGCRLHDACWCCAAPVTLLAQRSASVEPRCAVCDAVFAEGPARDALPARARLRALLRLVGFLQQDVPQDEWAPHLDTLARLFPADGADVRLRARRLQSLRPASWPDWFGTPCDARHADSLDALAGGRPERLHRLPSRHRREMRARRPTG